MNNIENIPQGAIGTTIIERLKGFYDIKKTKELQILTSEPFFFDTSVDIKEAKENHDVLIENTINDYIDLINNSNLIKMKDMEGSVLVKRKPLVKLESTLPIGEACRSFSYDDDPIEIIIPLVGFTEEEANEILSNNSCYIGGRVEYHTNSEDHKITCRICLLNKKSEEIISSHESAERSIASRNNSQSRYFSTPTISLKELSKEDIQNIHFCKIILKRINGDYGKNRYFYFLKDSIYLNMTKTLPLIKEEKIND